MINIPFIDRDRRERNLSLCGKDDTPCIVCGKPVKNQKYWLTIWQGSVAVKPDEITDDEIGGYPIGANCLRKNPQLKEYLID